MSERFGSDLDSRDNLDSQDDRFSDSGGDLLVESKANSCTAAPMTALAATAVDTHANEPTRSDFPSFVKLYGATLAVLGASVSTVSGFKGLFLFWVRVCKEKANRISYIDPDTTTEVENLFGLNLYEEDAFTGEEIYENR